MTQKQTDKQASDKSPSTSESVPIPREIQRKIVEVLSARGFIKDGRLVHYVRGPIAEPKPQP